MILNLLYFIINTVLAFAGSKPRCGKQVRGAAVSPFLFPCQLTYMIAFGSPQYMEIADFSKYEEEGIVELQIYETSPPPGPLWPQILLGEEENVILRQKEGLWTWS